MEIWTKLKERMKNEENGLVTICHQLKYKPQMENIT